MQNRIQIDLPTSFIQVPQLGSHIRCNEVHRQCWVRFLPGMAVFKPVLHKKLDILCFNSNLHDSRQI